MATWKAVVALAGLLVSGPVSAAVEHAREADSTGLRVEFMVNPVVEGDSLQAGSELETGFRIFDPVSQQGISDLHPAGWILKRDPEAGPPDAKSCESMVRTQAKGALSRPAAADLNNFLILTLNADYSVGFINPLVNLNTANLMALVPLNTPVAEWKFDAKEGRAYISLPEKNEVAVLDLNAKKELKRISVGVRPDGIELQPDRHLLWVANEGDGTITAIDTDELAVKQTLSIDGTVLSLSSDAGQRYLFAASNGGMLYVFDTQRLVEVRRVPLAMGDWALSYSDFAQALYAIHKPSGEVRVIDRDNWIERARLNLNGQVSDARVTPDGKHLLALSPDSDTVNVIPTAKNLLTRTLSTGKAPVSIAFTEDYAYIHNRDSAEVTLLQLSALDGSSSLPVVSIATGVKAPGDQISNVTAIASMPEGGGALIANPADRHIYYYMEGMLAPSNTLKTYTAPPIGLWVYDRSLQEVASGNGIYSTTVRIDEPGVYDVPFYLPTPQTIQCFELIVEENRNGKPAKSKKSIPRMLSWFDDQSFQAKQAVKLNFSLLNEKEGVPVEVEDGSVLSFRRGSHWQQRAKARHLQKGMYQVELQYPDNGEYYLLFRSRSLNIDYGEMKHLKVRIESDDFRGDQTSQVVDLEKWQ